MLLDQIIFGICGKSCCNREYHRLSKGNKVFLLNFLIPTSYRMSYEEKQEAIERAKRLQPGDMILIKTPSAIYSAIRTLGRQSYDHIVSSTSKLIRQAVVLDDQYSLHISYPYAKKAPTFFFTHKLRQPLIIRPTPELFDEE